MRLNYLVKTFLLATLTLLAACHDDEKPQPEHEGEGQLVATVGNDCGQALTLRVFGEGLEKPLDTTVDTTSATTTLDAWLPVGNYDLLLFPQPTKQVTISGTDRLASAVATVNRADGDTTLSPIEAPVYVAVHPAVALTERETVSLTLQPEDLRKIVRLTVTAPDGLIAGPVDVLLDGVAQTISLATGKATAAAPLAWRLPPLDAQGTSHATAGILGMADGAHLLTLSWQSTDGKAMTYSEDVSAQLPTDGSTQADTLDITVAATSRVPIRLYTSIKTRALVDAFDDTPVNIAAGREAGVYTESWAARATAGEIIPDPERYYPTDGSPVFLRGYYPAAPLEDGKVHYTLTGQEDLMLSVEQSGTLANRFDATRSPLVYGHLLTQLKFKIKLNGASDSYKLCSLKLDGLAAQAQVDLFAGTVHPVGKAAPLIIYTDPGTGGFPIVDGVLSLPGYVLVQPNAELTMDLILNIDNNPAHDLAFTDIPVRFTEGSEGGNAYTVEIELKIPDTPDEPDTPDTPDEPDTPDTPDTPDDPNVPDVPDVPDNPDTPDIPKDVTITITAKVTDWHPGSEGSIEIPKEK